MKVEGGLVVGYDSDGNSKIDGLTWSMRLVLSTGEVDLSEDAIEVSVFIANYNESRVDYDSTLNSTEAFYNANVTSQTYGMVFYDTVHDNQILDPGEIVRFFVKLRTSHEISTNDRVMIVIISSVAMMRVEKTAPVGIEPGMNQFR